MLIFFKNQLQFREWLEKNHATETELLVGFCKVKTGKPSMTWSESVDQALCFGWIDNVKKSIDEESYCIRFTPRKPGSHWSPINIEKVEALIKAGHMKPQGLSVYALRKPESSDVYHQMREDISLAPALEKQFKRNKKPGIFSRNSPHPTGRPPSNGL